MNAAPEWCPAGFSRAEWREVCGETTALLQRLIRIDTSNPPGREEEAARVVEEELARDGLRPRILQPLPGRASVVCRLAAGAAEPAEPGLLLASHLDVVPAKEPERWTHPPFGGELAEGMIWGRGAIDMKHMVAMSVMIMKLLARRGVRLKRDLVLASVADEEAGCTYGSRFLVEQHPDLVRAGFGVGEVGGFPIEVGRARFILVQTAEKGVCWLRMTARGAAGHGSVPCPDSAPYKLARALTRLAHGLPHHVTPVAETFIRALATPQGMGMRALLPALLVRGLGDRLLDHLPDRVQARTFHSILHNTVAPTVLRGGTATNVIPDSVEVELDGRLLPGQRPEDLIRELRAIVGDELELEVIRTHPPVLNHPPDSPLWDSIKTVLAAHHPELHLTPFMVTAFTDGAYFSRLGIRWYGFAPVWIDPASKPRFAELYHAIDERIPEDGLHWGLGLLYEVVHAFCAAG